MKDQNFIESLCILYPLYYWSLCNETHCAYLLLLITKPSTTKWVYTDSRALTYSIIRQTMRGYSAAQGDKPCLSCVWWFLFLLFFWHENATMSFLLLLGSIAACWAEQQPHTCFCFKSKSEWSAGQIVLHKRYFDKFYPIHKGTALSKQQPTTGTICVGRERSLTSITTKAG